MTAPVSPGPLDDRPTREEFGVVRLLANAPRYVRLLFGTLRDARVSWLDRTLVVAAIAYVVSPFDFIPDVIPVLGQVDDLLLIVAAVTRLFEQAPREVILSHWGGRAEELDPGALRKLLWFASVFALPGRRRRLRHLAGIEPAA